MRKKPAYFVIGILLLYGSMSLNNTLSRPSMAAARGVDIVSLMASGACFGAAIMAIGSMLRKRKD